MRAQSTLTGQQRTRLVDLFEQGHGYKAAANRLAVGKHAVRRLFQRWQLHSTLSLVEKPTKQTYSFETKKEIVDRFIAGEAKTALAVEFQLSSPDLVRKWAGLWRAGGDDGLRPKRRGRPKRSPAPEPLTREEKLLRENQLLKAENAYLKKLRDLREQGHA